MGINYPVRINAVRGQVYKFEELHALELNDSPCLLFCGPDGKRTNVHDVEEEDENSVLVGTQWTFIRQTDEYVPVFHYSGKEPLYPAKLEQRPSSDWDDTAFRYVPRKATVQCLG